MTKQKLDFGRVYDLIVEDEKIGRFLFAGRRKRINTTNLRVPRESCYIIMGIAYDRGVCLKLSGDQFSLEDGRIVTSEKGFNYLSPAEREHIEERLEAARL